MVLGKDCEPEQSAPWWKKKKRMLYVLILSISEFGLTRE
jgi:hypothetical protein